MNKEQIEQKAKELYPLPDEYGEAYSSRKFQQEAFIAGATFINEHPQPSTQEEQPKRANVNELQFLIKKYEIYISNINWHIDINHPSKKEVEILTRRINDYIEIVKDLKTLSSTQERSFTLQDMIDCFSTAWIRRDNHKNRLLRQQEYFKEKFNIDLSQTV